MDAFPDLAQIGGFFSLLVGAVALMAKILRTQYEERILAYRELIHRFEQRESESAQRERDLYERLIPSPDPPENQHSPGSLPSQIRTP